MAGGSARKMHFRVRTLVDAGCPDNVHTTSPPRNAAMSTATENRSERVDLRMTPAAKRTLTQAAAAENKTLTEFLLDRGLQAAYDTLADRRTFVLDAERWQAF